MEVDDIQRIGIVGAGLMGHGIALQFALGGYDVRLNDVSEESLARALDNIKTTLATLKEMGLVEDSAANQVPERIRTDTSLEVTLSGVDFVVEAVFEDMSLKQTVFAELDRLSPDRTILSSNTSSFMSSQLAPSTNRPGQVIVANWWNPPYLLPLTTVRTALLWHRESPYRFRLSRKVTGTQT